MKYGIRAAVAVTSLWAVFAQGEVNSIAEDTVSRTSAIERAVKAAVQLEALAEDIRAYNGAIKQAGYKPNPTLIASFEDFTGSGPFTGLGRTEATFSYSQKVERGGKRQARVALAQEQRRMAEVKWRIQRLDISRQAEETYIAVLVARAKLGVAKEQAAIATRIARTFEERVKKGRETGLALQSARLQQVKAEQTVMEAEQMLWLAKRDLATLWNMPQAVFSVDVSELQQMPASLPVQAFVFEDTPDMEIWDLNTKAASKSLKLEKSKAVQDITWNAGLRYTEQTGNVSVVAGFTIPLAFNDTNAGNISRAKAGLRKSEYDREAVKLSLERSYLLAQQKRGAAFAQIRRMETGLIPEAEKTEATALERLNRGVATDLDVYAAQSQKAEIQNQLITEYEAFHKAQAVINRLTARYDIESPSVASSAISSEEQ